MEQQNNRFKDLEMFLSVLIFATIALFIFYLIMAGNGQIVLKIISTVLIACICGFGLWLLHSSKELLRQRSIWMTLSFLSGVICTLVSLLTGYPGP